MALLNWNDSYRIGDAVIDGEHCRLFDMINDFHFTFSQNRDRRDILKVLNELVRYAEEHFRHEEQIMSERGYPELERHQDIHSGLFETLFALQAKLEKGTIGIEQEAVAFLRIWLTDHIVEEDKALGRFLAGS
jgi:hemerythrin